MCMLLTEEKEDREEGRVDEITRDTALKSSHITCIIWTSNPMSVFSDSNLIPSRKRNALIPVHVGSCEKAHLGSDSLNLRPGQSQPLGFPCWAPAYPAWFPTGLALRVKRENSRIASARLSCWVCSGFSSTMQFLNLASSHLYQKKKKIKITVNEI